MTDPDGLRDASPEDIELFARLIDGLPTYEHGDGVPPSLGPHSIEAIRTFSLTRPRRVLEVGFCIGRSASMWLHFGASVTSIENTRRPKTVAAAETMEKRFPYRFEVIWENSRHVLPLIRQDEPYDLIFIDGDHEREGVESDIRLGLELGIPTFVWDDWLPQYGPGVQPAFQTYRHKFSAPIVIGNLAMATRVP